ncbi:MAG TPA: hypothetical protein VFA32_21870, partial [Dehalococcoidia bacterium]|nr:hypothetical protein [Dehalococcoidia bacterium]
MLGEGDDNSDVWTKPVAQAMQKLATAGFSIPQVGQFICCLGSALGVEEILDIIPLTSQRRAKWEESKSVTPNTSQRDDPSTKMGLAHRVAAGSFGTLGPQGLHFDDEKVSLLQKLLNAEWRPQGFATAKDFPEMRGGVYLFET